MSVAQSLPALRQELLLHPGPRNFDGSPSWLLEDPGRDLYFQIGWVEAEILNRWHLGNPKDILRSIQAQTPLGVDSEQLTEFARFLEHNSLTRDGGAIARYIHEDNARFRQPLGKFLLRNYLFFRVPLLRPDRFLARTLPVVERVFFSRAFLLLTCAAALLGLFLVSRQWEAFSSSFLYFFSLEGAALSAATLGASKAAHELGHAYAAKRLGCRVPSMGLAFMVMMPLLYTDTSSAWRLRRRRQRTQVCAAGMMVETAMAAWATLAWSFLPDGPLRSAMFIMSTTIWIMTLTVNLSPFMRFDGYFLLSDILNVPNLQGRAFALARWKMREWLFALGADRPERYEPWRERVLIAYAFTTWVYRFFLFLGIALIVYHMFFKALGIVLFLVEVFAFILAPVYREMKQWPPLLRETSRFRKVTVCAALFSLVCILFVPWSSDIAAPALLQPERQLRIFAPVDSQVVTIHAANGLALREGDLLFELRAPELRREITRLRQQLAALQWQLSFHFVVRETAAAVPVVHQERQAALKRLALLEAQEEQLSVRAPFDGRIADMAAPLAQGEWIGAGEWLCTVIDATRPLAVAYVDEREMHRLQVGRRARFVPEDTEQAVVEMEVAHIDSMASRHLSAVPELASQNGGAIAAVRAPERVASALGAGSDAWVPELAVYKVLLRPVPGREADLRVVRGTVLISAEKKSLFRQFQQYALAVFLRETGF
ncbi:HlyD family efflux transporter periplasmic adaptor subunit [Pseudodesulfovibrio sp. F-1]|uniref:HlyD family efflux transporter periplasmic adaptor subunit n=1 Tax=Pseudodesulfovibrio alkaliphilus TaxID=2661613 RepID=A0A7K1KRH3_9BACT|nr:HlyD family efflux transporter periplasmic adaptor subunit [Pseudodesulfovibrio alkaliphilus]MUM78522.1 HlyD family efflux transporter periplasmic adaptor subunit [Pseudodesulfovibrio alkaliphilus]